LLVFMVYKIKKRRKDTLTIRDDDAEMDIKKKREMCIQETLI